MSEGFGFEVSPELTEELKKAINYDELNEISERFDNGTETEDDIINHCRNYGIEFENGNQLFVVEKKHFDKVIDLYQKEKERNKELDEKFKYAVPDEIVAEKYIHKNKIREKIKELEENVKEFEEYWSKDPRKFKKTKCIDYYKLEALQELLEENNEM